MPISDNDQEAGARPSTSAGLLRTFLLGPIRSLTPALLNILLMPVVVAKGGLHAVGLWGIFNLFIGLFLLTDCGVSQHLSRDISGGSCRSDEIRAAAESALGGWLLVAFATSLGLLLFSGPALASQGIVWSSATVMALPLLPFAGMAALLCGMLMFMHISANQVHYSQINQVVGAAVQFGTAIAFLQFAQPFIALLVALAVGYAVRAAGLYRNLRRMQFPATPRRPRWPSVTFVKDTFSKTRGFALLGMSQQLFHAVNRLGVLIYGGTAVLGAFEIASRIPFLLEQAFGNGLQPLFAVFSGADWKSRKGKEEMHKLTSWIYRLLVVTSVGCLAAWIALAGPVIGLWLNLVNPELVFATQLFALFNIVRAFNLPVFWVLQARGEEGWTGIIYMLQSALLIVLLEFISRYTPVTFSVIAIVITVLSISSETICMGIAQYKLSFISTVFTSWRDWVPLAIAAALVAVGWMLMAPPVLREDALRTGLLHSVPFIAAWGFALLALTGGRPWNLIRQPVA